MNRILESAQCLAVAVLLGGCATAPNCNERMPAHVLVVPETEAAGLAPAIRGEMRYPRESCLANRQGDVVLRFDLLRSGRFENVRIHQSSGDPLLDKEALRVMEVLQARGKTIDWPPGTPNKDRVTAAQTISFRL